MHATAPHRHVFAVPRNSLQKPIPASVTTKPPELRTPMTSDTIKPLVLATDGSEVDLTKSLPAEKYVIFDPENIKAAIAFATKHNIIFPCLVQLYVASGRKVEATSLTLTDNFRKKAQEEGLTIRAIYSKSEARQLQSLALSFP